MAQRPTNASTCDYYAQVLYGANTSDTQQNLIRHIVSLAFEGGSKLKNVSSDLTGILRPGKFGGSDIDLLQYFNGSRSSTNVNNVPIGINWLDQGGPDPLAAYLANETQTLTFTNTSNQYHLFGNFFFAFSRAFGCTLPFPPLPNTAGAVSLAYAHKFMNLEYNQLGYFIKQLAQASMYYGFSMQDADTFSTQLNSRYNVRCAPAVTLNPAQGPQLLSLCQNPTCPLAVPVSDCAAYVNLTAGPPLTSSPTTVVTTATAAVTIIPSGSNTADATNTPAPPATSSDKLSTGAIAGVAIGGAAVLVLAALALILLRRRKRNTPPATPAEPTTTTGWEPPVTSPTLTATSPQVGKHVSYFSTAAPPSEMDGNRYQSTTDHSRVGSPDMISHPSYQASAYPVEMSITPVEIDSAPVGGAPHWQQPEWQQQPQWQPSPNDEAHYPHLQR
ncbi:hypothetical protein GQ53DRAFT_711142 [Thozetella sp. PMI_491]|nr:hypothetical protein GQ53DRAFT_711142 [Thozetella sp. PMI_491]